MNYNNVNLWFAKDDEDKIVTIEEVNKEDGKIYHCPLCGSDLIPRQGDINSWHFAHEDKTKCDGESRIHWWVKNKLIEKGTKFTIEADETREYMCKEIFIEQSHKVGDKVYKPDITVLTESGETIYFEMAYTNKKKLEDYLDLWIELGNVVVEVDTKTLVESTSKSCLTFKALYYNGKCFNIRKSNIYYDTIGQYKEGLINKGEYLNKKADVERLDWFWKEVHKYWIDNNYDMQNIFIIIDTVNDQKILDIIFNILKKHKTKSKEIINAYCMYKKSKIDEYVKKVINEDLFNLEVFDFEYIIKIKELIQISSNGLCDYVIDHEHHISLDKNKPTPILLNEFSNFINKIIFKYNQYINTCAYIKNKKYNILHYKNKLIHIPSGCSNIIYDTNNIGDQVDIFNKKAEDIFSFYSNVDNIIQNYLNGRNVEYELWIRDLDTLELLTFDPRSSIIIVKDTEHNDILKRFKFNVDEKNIIIKTIKQRFLNKISKYKYEEQDIECYYNGYGSIVIRLYSNKYSNRCFRITDDLRISSLNAIDGIIDTAIAKIKQEDDMNKRRKRKDVNSSIKNDMLNEKINIVVLNKYIRNKLNIDIYLEYIKNENIFVLKHNKIELCELLRTTKKYIENSSKIKIYKRLLKEINKNIKYFNPIKDFESVILILSKFKKRYNDIWIKNHSLESDFFINESLDCIDFVLTDNDLDILTAIVKDKIVTIEKNDYKYENIEELNNIINIHFSNAIRKIRYGG